MKKENLAKLSLEELKTKLNTIQSITWVLVGVVILLFGITLYSTFKKGKFDVLMVVAFSSAAILPMQFKQISDIKKAIKNKQG